MEKEEKKIEKTIKEQIEIQTSLENTQKEIFKTIEEIKKVLSNHHESLQEITRINNTVEDTLLNVLLAVKQNTFLQAWYPAQSGHPEMHVTGSHPEKVAR